MNDKQLEFLKSEFNIGNSDIEKMSHDEIGVLYEKIADIEIEESVKCQDSKMSERGDIAISLVDYLCNKYL